MLRVILDSDMFVLPKGVDPLEYNRIPEPNIRITVEQFLNALFSNHFVQFISYCQPQDEDGKFLGSMHIYWGLGNNNFGVLKRTPKVFEFYKIGCNHHFQNLTRPAGNRSGFHTDKCTRCGLEWTYDTS